jgi:hypothetical protein
VSDISTFKQVSILTPEEKKKANQTIVNVITQCLFLLFSSDNEEMSEDEVEELLDQAFNIALVVMSILRVDVVGKNSNEDYVLKLTPYTSFAEFQKNNNF